MVDISLIDQNQWSEEQYPRYSLSFSDSDLFDSDVIFFSGLLDHILRSSFKVKQFFDGVLEVAIPNIQGLYEDETVAIIDIDRGIKACASELAYAFLNSSISFGSEEERFRTAEFISYALWERVKRCKTQKGVYVEDLFI